LWLAALLLSDPSHALAAPGTFVTALPVAQNQVILRFNIQPLFGGSGYANIQVPVNIGFGLTPRWAVFMNVNQGMLFLSNHPTTAGEGDTLVFIRNTLFKIDKPSSTFRIAPLAGAYLPTGSNHETANGALSPGELQSGSGTVDPYFGVTSGYNTTFFGAAADSTWRYNPVAGSGFSPGNQFRADGQIEFRLAPLHLPEEGLPDLLVLSLEANYAQTGSSHKNGVFTGPSGSKTFSQDALLELATLRWEVGGGVQIPEMESFATSSPVKQHIGYYTFFEFYLATPSWRHKGAR
jgi:hypothetical protein